MTKVPLPQRFLAAGTACGIKDNPRTPDLALFVSEVSCTSAGVFTQNRVCGAPVQVSRTRVPRTTTRAVIINSGNANACTGQRGLDDARWMTAEIAQRLDCPPEDVLVCSTGVIGRPLPREKLAAGIPVLMELLGSDPHAFLEAARGMMTTDTVPKQAFRTFELASREVRLSAVAKGAAMIGPNMATMLAVILTDLHLDPRTADTMLRQSVDRSFNCISVEGHTSTSDSVILLANGASGVELRSEKDSRQFQEMLDGVTRELAQAIVRDAEGAAHFVTVRVRGTHSPDQAKRIAQTIANDVLVKTAITGNDPNWGRIVSCCGRTGVELNERDVTLSINGTLIFQAGSPAEYDEQAVRESMSRGDVELDVQLPFGDASVEVWTSDLTQEYVRLNSEYTT
ncbi:MAG: bifunctional glutamate N-acetyltransferase/amino-acid acetyltransferase ArgJ [Planctomycetes bacterium]|nr:bifunctional glutamate N-acetyltransferase/amino-acid acetyltransferase ArgJ [Planctomycetota bacterium]